MQGGKLFDEIVRQNKILERRNDELLMLLESWKVKAKNPVVKLVDSLNMHEIENLIIRFYQVYKVPISLYNEEGKLLFSMGWKNICLKFHRNNRKTVQNCRESIDYIQHKISDYDCFSFQCKNNINVIAIPITLQGQNIGTLVLSQFLYTDELPDEDSFTKVAEEAGFDFEEYKKTIRELPRVSASQIEIITEHYILFAEMISYFAGQNLFFNAQKKANHHKDEIWKMFKDKLEEQADIIKTVHLCLLQQHMEIENLKIELLQYKEQPVPVMTEKSPV